MSRPGPTAVSSPTSSASRNPLSTVGNAAKKAGDFISKNDSVLKLIPSVAAASVVVSAGLKTVGAVVGFVGSVTSKLPTGGSSSVKSTPAPTRSESNRRKRRGTSSSVTPSSAPVGTRESVIRKSPVSPVSVKKNPFKKQPYSPRHSQASTSTAGSVLASKMKRASAKLIRRKPASGPPLPTVVKGAFLAGLIQLFL